MPATVQQGRRRTVVLRPRAAADGHNAERIPLTPRRRRPRRGRSSIDASSTESSSRRRTSRRRFERRQAESISPGKHGYCHGVPEAGITAHTVTRPAPLSVDSEAVYSTVDLPSTPGSKGSCRWRRRDAAAAGRSYSASKNLPSQYPSRRRKRYKYRGYRQLFPNVAASAKRFVLIF